jgi:signal transduction histidine kinase
LSFKVFPGLLIDGLLWLMYRLRVRQVAGRIRLLAEERSRERIKIARDLHDTLLQGIHGLTLRFHYSAQKVSDSAERAALENALESADKILDEGGERVRHLRTSPLPAATLPGSISLIGEVAFCVSVQGTPHALREWRKTKYSASHAKPSQTHLSTPTH